MTARDREFDASTPSKVSTPVTVVAIIDSMRPPVQKKNGPSYRAECPPGSQKDL